MMKRILITLTALCFLLAARAQDKDTTIYTSFRLKSTNPDPANSFEEDPTADAPVFDSAPQFPTGLAGFYSYISTHLQYAENDRGSGNHGRVMVEAVIEKDGSLTNLKVIRSVSKSLDKEALRVIASAPRWKAAVYHGKPVRVRWNFTVNFEMENGNY